MNVPLAPTGHSAPTSATVRTEPNVTTSTGHVSVTTASKDRAVKTGSVPVAYMESCVINNVPVSLNTHSGTHTHTSRLFLDLVYSTDLDLSLS